MSGEREGGLRVAVDLVKGACTDSAPTVIYIAGSGRSGSTLLERTLGEIPGFVNVGELIDVFRQVIADDEMCGCGQPFLECPFWTAVGKRAYGGWAEDGARDHARLQQQLVRQRRIPQHLLPRPRVSQRSPIGLYGEWSRALYAAIAEESGAGLVVDASKWPSQALALSRAGIDVRVIYLVRDPRGVAYSHAKSNVERPHSHSHQTTMWHIGPKRAALNWRLIDAEIKALGVARTPISRVRYEDFVKYPAREVSRALEELGLSQSEAGVQHIHGGAIMLGSSHGVSGNPSRFRAGEIRVRADEEWRSKMPWRDRIAVSAITFPETLLVRRRARGEQLKRSTAESPRPSEPESATEPLPCVSVLLPTHGRPELVRQAIRGVMDQTYEGEIECLVIHDREPADHLLRELGEPGREVKVLSNQHGAGLAGARNTGVDHASGALIATCDDDDRWHPEKLKLQVQHLLTHKDLLLVGSGLRLVSEGKEPVDWPGRSDTVSRESLLRNRVKELHSSSLLMWRDAYAKVGRYDEGLPNGYGEDYDWVLRASRVGRIGIVRQVLVDIRRGESYYTDRYANTLAGLEAFLEKHPEIRGSRRGYARILGQIAFVRSCLGQRRAALGGSLKSMYQWPVSPYPLIALAHAISGADAARMRRLAARFGRELV